MNSPSGYYGRYLTVFCLFVSPVLCSNLYGFWGLYQGDGRAGGSGFAGGGGQKPRAAVPWLCAPPAAPWAVVWAEYPWVLFNGYVESKPVCAACQKGTFIWRGGTGWMVSASL